MFSAIKGFLSRNRWAAAVVAVYTAAYSLFGGGRGASAEDFLVNRVVQTQTYKARPGDTLWGVSKEYFGGGASLSEVRGEVDRVAVLNGKKTLAEMPYSKDQVVNKVEESPHYIEAGSTIKLEETVKETYTLIEKDGGNPVLPFLAAPFLLGGVVLDRYRSKLKKSESQRFKTLESYVERHGVLYEKTGRDLGSFLEMVNSVSREYEHKTVLQVSKTETAKDYDLTRDEVSDLVALAGALRAEGFDDLVYFRKDRFDREIADKADFTFYAKLLRSRGLSAAKVRERFIEDTGMSVSETTIYRLSKE